MTLMMTMIMIEEVDGSVPRDFSALFIPGLVTIPVRTNPARFSQPSLFSQLCFSQLLLVRSVRELGGGGVPNGRWGQARNAPGPLLFLSHTLTHTHSHTHALSHTQTYTHSSTHTLTHSHTLSLTHTHSLGQARNAPGAKA